jgi:hypothetical protein
MGLAMHDKDKNQFEVNEPSCLFDFVCVLEQDKLSPKKCKVTVQ